MPVTRFEITLRRSVAGAPGYEELKGRLHFAIDPRHAANRRITDVELAPRDAQGRVTWDADVSILLPVDPATLEELHRSGKRELVVQRIQEGLELGQRLGCTVGGLGAYTSIVTADGTALVAPPGMKLSTGNALTVAVGVHRVSKLCRRHGIDATAPSTRLGILGAAGSIGSALAPPHIAKAMAALQSHTTTGANHPAQSASVTAFNDERVAQDVTRMVAAFRRRRDLLVSRFRTEVPGVEFVEPHGAFYFFFRVDGIREGVTGSTVNRSLPSTPT
jgi:predicted amino acid dehydrogenase